MHAHGVHHCHIRRCCTADTRRMTIAACAAHSYRPHSAVLPHASWIISNKRVGVPQHMHGRNGTSTYACSEAFRKCALLLSVRWTDIHTKYRAAATSKIPSTVYMITPATMRPGTRDATNSAAHCTGHTVRGGHRVSFVLLALVVCLACLLPSRSCSHVRCSGTDTQVKLSFGCNSCAVGRVKCDIVAQVALLERYKDRYEPGQD